MKMTLQQMRYVSEIVKNGSIRSAAETLYVTQPNISKQIKMLEGELGIRIFDQLGNRSVLTEDGKRIIQHFNEVLANVEFIEENFSAKWKVDMKFSVSSQHYTFASRAFSNLLKEISTDSYCFSLHYERTVDVFKSVSNRKSEIGVILENCEKKHSFQRLFDSYGLEFHPLIQMKAHIFLAKDHPLAKNKEVTAKDLEPYPCIVYTQDESTPNFLMEEVFLPQIFPKKTLLISDLYASKELIENSQAYDIGTGLLGENMRDRFSSVAFKDSPDICVGWLSTKDKEISPLGKRYVELLKEAVREMEQDRKILMR
ncbi:MAG: LysR family transcriptional regulator [Peptococcaceae bacterium]|nr:LysR family transcriptional regulator [Peptococcaceae bacterium]